MATFRRNSISATVGFETRRSPNSRMKFERSSTPSLIQYRSEWFLILRLGINIPKLRLLVAEKINPSCFGYGKFLLGIDLLVNIKSIFILVVLTFLVTYAIMGGMGVCFWPLRKVGSILRRRNCA